jgi:hypothetical protein
MLAQPMLTNKLDAICVLSSLKMRAGLNYDLQVVSL